MTRQQEKITLQTTENSSTAMPQSSLILYIPLTLTKRESLWQVVFFAEQFRALHLVLCTFVLP